MEITGNTSEKRTKSTHVAMGKNEFSKLLKSIDLKFEVVNERFDKNDISFQGAGVKFAEITGELKSAKEERATINKKLEVLGPMLEKLESIIDHMGLGKE